MLDSDIKFFRGSGRTNDPATNGGRMTAEQVTSGVPGNVWDVIRSTSRIAQTQEWEKVFCVNHNSSNEVGYSPKIYLDGDPAAGDDWAYFVPSTQRGYQSDLTGSEEKYVAGQLKTAITDVATTAVVAMKDAEQAAAWKNGDTVRFQSARAGASPTKVDVTLTAAPIIAGLDVTLSFAAIGTAFAEGTSVSRVYAPSAPVKPTLDTTSHTGGADVDSGQINLDNRGTVEQTWTLTLLAGATTYTLVGDELGNVGTGDISTVFEPDNPDYSQPYVSIPPAAFAGLTLAEGDTFTFQTHPSGVPIFLFKENPANAALVNSNSFSVVMAIEA